MTAHLFTYFVPELIVLVAAALVLVVGLVLETGPRPDPAMAQRVSTAVGLVGVLAALGWLFTWDHRIADPLSGTFIQDGFGVYIKGILLVFGAVTLLIGYRFAERFKPHQSEFIGLILLATVAGMFMASAREMIELYVALETLSLALYALVAFDKRQRMSSEAAIKYLVVGAASSAILLFGLAILYGLTGRTNLDAVATAVVAQGSSSPALVLATIFVIGGLSFKIAAVPFHQWVPDVYQGAPTPVTAFIAVSSKAAGYGLLARVLTSALLPLGGKWALYLAVVAAITMTVGNVTALSQTSLKRLLGYSSIAHAGYIVLGLVAVGAQSGPSADLRTLGFALGAVLFYIFVYGLTNLAAFGAVQAAEEGVGSDDISALVGLSRRSGPLALVLAGAMLSLTGIPPFIGFFAKFFIFLVAVQAGYAWLVVIALANSALSAVYYLRVVRSMYLDEGRSPRPFAVGTPMWAALGIGSAAILPLAIFASRFVDLAQQGAHSVFLR